MGKSVIRLITNNTPLNRFEVGVLDYIFSIFDGKLPHEGLMKLLHSNIKGVLGLSGSEVMYFYSLYKINYLKSGDFSSIENVIVPKLYDYNVNYLQDVSAWRYTTHNIIASNEQSAIEAMDYDFDNADEEVSKHVSSGVEVGDYQDVFDTEITQNQHAPINETVKIIKKVLREYKNEIK